MADGEKNNAVPAVPVRYELPAEAKQVKVGPFEIDPPFPGGLPPSGASRIPSDMPTYIALKRPALLPGLHSKDREFHNEDVEANFMELFQGESTLTWFQESPTCLVMIGDEKKIPAA